MYKYYRVLNEEDPIKDLSPISLELSRITGFYSNDYIKPVIKAGDLLTIVADESEFKGYVLSGLVILPYLDKEFLSRKENELEKLTEKYGINSIHFTDIFGKAKVLGQRRDEFLQGYSSIVSEVQMSCLSITQNESTLKQEVLSNSATKEEIFFCLFWNNFEKIVAGFPNFSIFHIYTEQEYSLNVSKYDSIVNKLFQKLYSGIDQVYSKFPEKYISVCKHPHFFQRGLFYSSLSDLLAYSSCKLQNKIDLGISEKKIIKEYMPVLKLFKAVFYNYSGLSSEKLIELIQSVN